MLVPHKATSLGFSDPEERIAKGFKAIRRQDEVLPQNPRRRSPANRVQPQSRLTPNIARRSEAGITTRDRLGSALAQARLTCNAGPSMARHSGHRAPTKLMASVSQCLGAPAAYSQRPKPLRA